MDSNDDQIDERKLTELDEEVSNYLEMENLNSKESKNHIYGSYLNNYNNNNPNLKFKEDIYFESKLDTCSSLNRINTYATENNVNSSRVHHMNLYENLLAFKEKNNNLNVKLQDFAATKSELEERNKRILELESINSHLKDENNTLSKRVDAYQNQIKDWEVMTSEIKNKFLIIENENKTLREESEDFKQKYEDCDFKLKLLKEKEKIHENSVTNLKEVQKNYETSLLELKKDYKNKEENLRKKYDLLEEENSRKIKDIESDNTEKIENLSDQLKDSQKYLEKLLKENHSVTDKLENLDKFFRNKEAEFEEIVEQKDRKLKELEKSINIISEEAQSQIYKLTQSVSDFNEKINSYHMRENQLVNENSYCESQIKNLNDKIANYEKIINKLEKQNDTFSVHSNPINKSYCSIDNTPSLEKYKIKLKEKDNYSANLEKEIEQLKNELANKDEDYEKVCSELKRNLYKNENGLQQLEYKLAKKEEDLNIISKKNTELCQLNSKLQDSLNNFKRKIDICEKENKAKGEEQIKMKKNYEKIITDLQSKLEEVILRDNQINIGNNRIDSDHKPTNFKEKYYETFISKELPDDEKIRKSINDQINYIRNKLDKK